MPLRIRRCLLAAFCLCLLAAPVAAQTGTIVGRVTDVTTEAPVVGALVEALGADGRVVANAVTNHEGRFRIASVPAASYTMSVSGIGYGTQRLEIVSVSAGATATANLSVRPVALELMPVVVSVSKELEKAIDAPARVETVTEREIQVRPAITPVDHLRSTPAVDVITSGLQSTNVVVRGFNNIFSGSLHALTDNRIAGIPSLRVNLMHFVPQTSEDFERMEVVLGPGSALYGPNTANGVLHMITKSTLGSSGSAFSIAGGERSALHFNGRTSHALSDRFGVKLSGQYFRGDEWEFRDSVEVRARRQADTNFAAWSALQPAGLSQAQLQARAGRLAARDFDVVRWSLDGRVDWRLTDNFAAIFTAGRTSASKGIELTGIGAAQVNDWAYGYYQARFTLGSWFAQAYVNTSSAGDTYLLRTGAPIVDDSKVAVAQIQNSASLGNRLQFVYGGDFIRTIPETGGTINGSREDADNYNQYGAYVQARATVSPRLDLVAAVREDWHTQLEDPVFSPRAALVFKPTPAQNVRFTYNRAFSTPTSLNLFLDIDGGPAGALGPLGFRVRAQGPGKDGIRLADATGNPLGMRSPFVPGQLLAVNSGTVYDAQLTGIIAALPANLRPLLQQLGPALRAGATQIGVVALNPVTQGVGAVTGSVADVPGIKPSISSTFEVGYKGVLGERVLLAADVWRSTEKDFTSPLVVRTPLYLLNPQQFATFLTQNAAPTIVQTLVQAGLPLEQAQQQAGTIISNWVQIPGGVASSTDVTAESASLVATYVNFGELDLWGVDLSTTILLTDAWSLRATASFVSDHNFCLVETTGNCPTEQLVALNAPREKGTITLGYRGLESGFNGELRLRRTGEFPVNSADFVGLECIGVTASEPCVEAYTLVDLSLGYELPRMRGASLQLGITNLFDADYRSFVGVPRVGRLALLRLRYAF